MTERAKRRFSQKTADFCRFTPSPGNSSIWTAQGTTENRRFRRKSQATADFAENHKQPQIGLRHLTSVTLSSALKSLWIHTRKILRVLNLYHFVVGPSPPRCHIFSFILNFAGRNILWVEKCEIPDEFPSDTKLVLTKHYSEISTLPNLRISVIIPRKSRSFPEI